MLDSSISGCAVKLCENRSTIVPVSYGGGSMVKLEFHDPSGALEVTQPFAPRLHALEGKRIGFVSNEQWQAYRMLPMLKELLETEVPGFSVLPIVTFPAGNALFGEGETVRVHA